MYWKVKVTNTQTSETWWAYGGVVKWDFKSKAEIEAQGIAKQWPELFTEVIEFE